MAKLPKPAELLDISYNPPKTPWMETPVEFREGMYCHAGKPESAANVSLPNAREWRVPDDDWQLPENWKEIILQGLHDRLDRFRSLKIFMDCCVRCGACADKCHFFLGSGDPKNMPVLRAELLRSVYRKEYTLAGKLMGSRGGLIRNLILGVVGSAVGNWLAGTIGIAATGSVGAILIGVGGACVVILIARWLFH